MSYMFAYMDNLTSLTLPASFNTSSVTNMKAMFRDAEDLTSLTLPASFVVNSGMDTESIFLNIPTTAVLNAGADDSVKALWPGATATE